MKPSDSSSTKPFSALAPPAAPEAPSSDEGVLLRFPSFEEVLQHEAGVALHPLLQLGEAPPPESPSLFQGLLGGQLEVLLDDVARNPSRYDDRTQALLTSLAAGTKRLADLEPAERVLLDHATLDFASFRPPKPAAPRAPPPPPKKPALLLEQPMEDGRAPQVEIPGSTLSAYWWLT